MPLFSNKSWEELQDVWPKELRIVSDAYKIVCMLAPAWVLTQQFIKANYGESIAMRDFLTLCWLQRCEDARENVAFDSFPALKGLNMGGKLWYSHKSALTRLGLIENIPTRVRLYRITATGKMIIRKFVENIEQANQDLHRWMSYQPPEQVVKITKALKKFIDFEEPTKEEPAV